MHSKFVPNDPVQKGIDSNGNLQSLLLMRETFIRIKLTSPNLSLALAYTPSTPPSDLSSHLLPSTVRNFSRMPNQIALIN